MQSEDIGGLHTINYKSILKFLPRLKKDIKHALSCFPQCLLLEATGNI